MLALRLVLTEAPDTLIFDEVDAGIGGQAAVAVGEALRRLGDRHQVLIVTHLPQVAAQANTQVLVAKGEINGRTQATATVLDRAQRVEELARMLAGHGDSKAARAHARELMASSDR
jgi:DNA repair protein RecN (Recombination protein N)